MLVFHKNLNFVGMRQNIWRVWRGYYTDEATD